MNENRKNMILKVLDLIKEDYVFYKSTIELQGSYFCDLHCNDYKRVDYLFKATRQDFNKILTIMNCIESTYSMYRDNSYRREYVNIKDSALEEIACHIEYLFIKYRVILEYMQEIIEICIPPILPCDKKDEYDTMKKKKGAKAKVEADRFEYLLKYISMNVDENKELLNTNWFQDFRESRNFLVHRGAGCLVYDNKDELLFSVMKIDEMEREDKLCIDDYFLSDNLLIKYHRFWGIMLSELIVFCEAIFGFLLNKASISAEQQYCIKIVNCSKRKFASGKVSDKQTILEKMLYMLLNEEND